MNKYIKISIAFIFSCSNCYSQSYEVITGDTINRIDKQGYQQGIWKYYDNQNQLFLVCNYKDSKPIGRVDYYENNKLVLNLEYFEGKSDFEFYFPDLNKKGQTKQVDGKRRYFFENGDELTIEQSTKIVIETNPYFVGGKDSLQNYFKNNLIYPEKSKKKEASVIVSFIVRKNGEVDNVKIVKDGDELFDIEAVRLVKNMPRWRPGTQRAFPVAVMQKLPINFKK